jgi:hypothetical protein
MERRSLDVAVATTSPYQSGLTKIISHGCRPPSSASLYVCLFCGVFGRPQIVALPHAGRVAIILKIGQCPDHIRIERELRLPWCSRRRSGIKGLTQRIVALLAGGMGINHLARDMFCVPALTH